MRKRNYVLLITTIVAMLLAVATIVVLLCVRSMYSDFKLLMTVVYALLCLVPYLLLWIFRWRLPNYISIAYIAFVTCSTLGGTIYGLYDIISIYDTVLHAISGVLLGAFGLYVYRVVDKGRQNSTLMIGLFTISFATAGGVLWEFWEFWSDDILGLNSQRHTGLDGVAFVGHEAIRDTIYDLIADMVGAILFYIGYVIARKILSRRQPIVNHTKIALDDTNVNIK